MFFVISALTLCISWSDKYGNSDGSLKTSRVLSFYKRRFLAIAPGYYTIILIGYIINRFVFNNLSISKNLMLQTNQSISAIIANVLFCNGLVPGANNNVVFGGWYVGTSMIFYGCFPFLYLLASKCRELLKNGYKMIVPASFILWIFIYQVWCRINNLSFNIENSSFAYFFIGNQMPVLLCGVVLYFMRKDGQLENVKYPLIKSIALGVVAFLGVILQAKIEFPLMFAFVPLVVGLSFSYLLIYVEYGNIWKFEKLVDFFEKWGKISYSVYLVHQPFVWIMPAAVVKILSRIHIEYDGTFLWLILLIPMYLCTYLAASIFDKYLKIITPYFEKGLGLIKRVKLHK